MTVLLQMIVSNRNVLIQDIVEMPLSHSSVISNFIDAYQVESIYDKIFYCLQVTGVILNLYDLDRFRESTFLEKLNFKIIQN